MLHHPDKCTPDAHGYPCKVLAPVKNVLCNACSTGSCYEMQQQSQNCQMSFAAVCLPCCCNRHCDSCWSS
jgi:hypothetical protein